MTEALDEQGKDHGRVLTESEREDIVLGKRSIRVRPLTEWLCGLDDWIPFRPAELPACRPPCSTSNPLPVVPSTRSRSARSCCGSMGDLVDVEGATFTVEEEVHA
jgi:hypothetical protein